MADAETPPSFGQVRREPCEWCGGKVIYRFGNWYCGGYRGGCGWSTARDGDHGNRLTLERCPECGARIVYNGNYFCERRGDGCSWALPHPSREKADRELALRLTGETR